MANSFSKEEIVAFENMLEGFQDGLILSRNVSKYSTDSTTMARTNDVIWRPQPYIMQSYDGMDQTANFQTGTQLAVPATLGFYKSVPWTMNALELRDALQENRLGDAAKQRLASNVNVSIMNVAAAQGSLVVKVTGAPGDYGDIAQCDAIMNEQGIPDWDRFLAMSSRDYNGIADNLQTASRSFGNAKSDKAFERSYVGPVAGFQTYKLDYANRIAAAGGGSRTINTTTAGAQYYVPVATRVATTGESSNVDNRFQQVTVSATTGVAAGDCFTIDGDYAVHHITKQSTGYLKTYRVISVDSGTTMTITPPRISAQGGSDAELQYQNITVTSSATAAITWLNTAATNINPFWQKDALEILPGYIAIPSDAGTAVLRATTDQGIELVLQKWYDIKTATTLFRADAFWGVVNKQPEMSGIILWNQV